MLSKSVQSRDRLEWFRERYLGCLQSWSDVLFEVTDALLCHRGRVDSLAELSLEAVVTRGHGSVYAGLNAGRIDIVGLAEAVAAAGVRKVRGRIVLAVDVCNWLRPDAACSPERLFCHVHGRGRSADQIIPGWPYSFVGAVGAGSDAGVDLLDAIRLGPHDDLAQVTAAQLRAVVERLIAFGQWQDGDEPVLIVADAGYDPARLSYLLCDLPVIVCARVRSDRVYYRRPEPTAPGRSGRPAKHGAAHRCADPDSWGATDAAGRSPSERFGSIGWRAWHRLHPRLTQRSAWIGHDRALPVLEGVLIRLDPERLPHGGQAETAWLWASMPEPDPEAVQAIWTAWLLRFRIEHAFRFLKQRLGWDRPILRDPAAADRWTAIVIVAYTQLRLARPLAADARLPWQRPLPPEQLTPGRVKQGFANLHRTLIVRTGVPKPSRPGPGRPKGKPNARKAIRHDPGKTTKRPTSITERDEQARNAKP